MRAFVRGMAKGLRLIYAEPAEAAAIAKAQFPTMPAEDLRATLDRSYRDEMWTRDGSISRQAWTTAMPRCARPASSRRISAMTRLST